MVVNNDRRRSKAPHRYGRRYDGPEVVVINQYGYSDPYYSDPYYSDPYYASGYPYRDHSGSLLDDLLEAIFFSPSRSAYAARPTYYAAQPAYYGSAPRGYGYPAPPSYYTAYSYAPRSTYALTLSSEGSYALGYTPAGFSPVGYGSLSSGPLAYDSGSYYGDDYYGSDYYGYAFSPVAYNAATYYPMMSTEPGLTLSLTL